jgi:anti-anti-sigma factor
VGRLTSRFEIRVEPTVDNRTRMIVSGDIDSETSEMLFDELVDVLAAGDTRHVEVDLAAVTILDASGVGVLLAAQHRADTAGKALSVCSTTGLPLQVLEITGVLGRLHGKSADAGRDRQSDWNPWWLPHDR